MEIRKIRNYNSDIVWEGDLNDDCTAKWCGLLLRAEWMDGESWWWCVYDMLNNEKQIDSSNNYNIEFTGGKLARERAETIAKNYLAHELVTTFKTSKENINIELLLTDLKTIGISPMQTIMVLIKDFNFEYSDAKNIVFDSPLWKGLREQSEALTQFFFDEASKDADDVEYSEDGEVKSVTFNLTKDDSKKKE